MIGTPCEGATIYVTCQPCNMCAKMIINAGIQRVIYEGDYPDEFSLELFRESGMEVFRFREEKLERLELEKRPDNVPSLNDLSLGGTAC